MTDTQLAFDLEHIPDRSDTPVPWRHILPDLPGKVHGIKATKPYIVQCDGCGRTAAGEKVVTIILSRIIFNERAGVPGLRQCMTCWKRDGWTDEYRGWVHR